jgi:YesN/AraC family two-component response regulator
VKIKFGRDLGDYIVASYMAAIMYITTFYIIRNSIVFKPESAVISNTAKYQKSSLKDVDKEMIINRLEILMKEEKVFKNNLLSLNELSKKAGIAPHHLSQVLNESTGKTFFEYLATFRVEEAQKILSSESNNLTIEEIAEEVGYNSKSAFNKIFKKYTGYTPSEYRENTKNNSARS